ncbi:MAG: polysaccharide deacetylase family protein [Bacteroidota bacterium]|nr:polysaccharide deacetylase family protein [Bacteroidota bacterium]
MSSNFLPYIQKIFPAITCRKSTTKRQLWLTFDDGPNPEITQWVLKQLDILNIKATFFLVGNKIESHPNLYNLIIKRGHVIGNHSYSHKNGWKTSTKSYIDDVARCEELLKGSNLFRPPYGKITPLQIKKLKLNYRIILWDVLSYDFKKNISVSNVKNNVLNNVKPGSIIVFHNNFKSYNILQKCLADILKELKQRGYSFSTTW